MSDEKMVSVPESVLRRWNDNAGYMEPEDFQHELRSYLPPEKPEWCLETTGYKLRIMGSGREGEFVASVFHEKGLAAAHVGATRSQIEGLQDTCTKILGDGEPVEYERHEPGGLTPRVQFRVLLKDADEAQRRLDMLLPVEPKREPVPFTERREPGWTDLRVRNEDYADARAALEAGAPVKEGS